MNPNYDTIPATREEAEAVLKQIQKFFGCDDPVYGPQIVENFDWVGDTPMAIVWEGGSYDWAVIADFEIEKAEGIWTEAITSWSTAVWKNVKI